MKKTRWMLIGTLTLVTAGLGFGLIGMYSRRSVEAQGSAIPKVIHYLPQNAEAVAFVDVRKLVYSPAYQAFEKEHGHRFTYELQEFIFETGLDPRQDLDSVAFAALPKGNGAGGVAVITGRYDQARVVKLLTERGRAEVGTYQGFTVYVKLHDKHHSNQTAATFLSATHLVFGDLEAVQQTIDVFRGARPGVVTNVEFTNLLAQTNVAGTFWLVNVHTDFLTRMHQRNLPEKMRANAPQIQNLILDADLGNIVTASLRSRCTDAKAAQNLSDFARGLVALGKMVTANQPELAGLFEDIRITQNQELVSVEFAVPFEDLRKLQHLREQGAAAIKAF